MAADCTICSTKCYGNDGNHGGCCNTKNRDYIIGPHIDSKKFVDNLSERFGREIAYDDVFILYEEGHKLYPNKSHWQMKKSYPALRVNSETEFCNFYNTTVKACTVYSIRPSTCQEYECDYLKSQTNSK